MRSNYDSIIFSPHLDDAVFSLGAMLLAGFLGKVKIINVFSRSRYTINGLGDEEKITAERILEDGRAVKYLSVDAVYWGYPDSSIKPEYADEEHYMDPKRIPENDTYFRDVHDAINNEFKEHKQSVFFAPLSIGNHIDHRIVTTICTNYGSADANIVYYEDGTYFTSLQEARNFTTELQLTTVLAVDPGNMSDKIRLAGLYSSQVNEAIYENLKESYLKCRGERLWSAKKYEGILASLIRRYSSANKMAHVSLM